MKKILLLYAVMLVLNQSVFSQNAEKTFTIQTSPFLLFSDIFVSDVEDTLFIMDLEGQYTISKSSNISLTLSFRYDDRTVWEYDYESDADRYSYRETIFQIGFKPMYIYRPFETGIKGFYIGFYPNIGFQYSTIEDNSTLYIEPGFGLNVGYKWVLNSGFTMQLGGGIGKTFSIPQKTNQDAFINSDGRMTIGHSDISILDFKLGYSF